MARVVEEPDAAFGDLGAESPDGLAHLAPGRIFKFGHAEPAALKS